MTDLQGRELIEYVDAHLDRCMDRLDKGLEPVWQAQNEMGKAVISLSSGILVLSISVAQYLGTKGASPDLSWLLPVAWTLLAAAVVAGTIRQSWVSQARSMRVNFELKRADIRRRLWELQPGPSFPAQVDEILDQALGDAAKPSQRGINVHNALNQVMFWSFTGGLISLLAFAIKNFPF